MAFGLYTLLEAGLLFVNAVAVLNDQRFLAKCIFFYFYLEFLNTYLRLFQ